MEDWSAAEDAALALAEAGRDEAALGAVRGMQRAIPGSSVDGWHLEARLLSRLGRRGEALDRLEAAVRAGDIWRPRRLDDRDYDPLRQDPRFLQVVARARQAAADRHRQPRLLTSLSARANAPLLLVFHGAASTAEPALATWAPAGDLGYTVAALQSSQPAGPDAYCWDEPEQADADVRWAIGRLPSHGRVVVAGFSQGARLALRLALDGSLVQPGGAVLVGPSLVEPLPPSARRLRVAVLMGSDDPYAKRSAPALRELSARGHYVQVENVPGLGHAYPDDFAERLPGLLDRVTRLR